LAVGGGVVLDGDLLPPQSLKEMKANTASE